MQRDERIQGAEYLIELVFCHNGQLQHRVMVGLQLHHISISQAPLGKALWSCLSWGGIMKLLRIWPRKTCATKGHLVLKINRSSNTKEKALQKCSEMQMWSDHEEFYVTRTDFCSDIYILEANMSIRVFSCASLNPSLPPQPPCGACDSVSWRVIGAEVPTEGV